MLLGKLHFYGIRGVAEDWFTFYLTKTKQKVELKLRNTTKTFFSDWGTLQHGVPQASIIGTRFFLINKKELPLRINSISQPVYICVFMTFQILMIV